MVTNTSREFRRSSCHFRIVAFFWLFVALIAAVLLTVNHWDDLAAGNAAGTLSEVLICCLLAFSGYGLSREKLSRRVRRVVLALVSMFLAGLVLILTGCSHTHVSDGSGTSSPSGKFRLAVACDGANGCAYTKKTRKKIQIGIWSGNDKTPATLFERSYTVTGSDITWETHWSTADTVSVEIYDWGDGVSNYNNLLHLAASNHIALLVFTLDKSTGGFVQRR
jgi:hypothetical protein